jgi:hypothetical protein
MLLIVDVLLQLGEAKEMALATCGCIYLLSWHLGDEEDKMHQESQRQHE